MTGIRNYLDRVMALQRQWKPAMAQPTTAQPAKTGLINSSNAAPVLSFQRKLLTAKKTV